MLDSTYHMTFKLFCNHIFSCENVQILPNIYGTLLWASFHNINKICKPLVIYQF